LRPILRFGTARARLDIKKGAVRVHLAAEHALEFQLAYACFERAGVALDITRNALIVLAFRHIQQRGGIAYGATGAVEVLEFDRQTRTFPAEFLGADRVAPDGRIFKFATYFFEALFFSIVLKETPSRRRHAPRDLSKYASAG